MTQEINAYNEALQSGQYQRHSGLLGKYDNVRCFWEDEQLGSYLEPYLGRLVERKKACGEKLRILDIGCGSGDGFEFITSIDDNKAPLSAHNSKLVTPDMLEIFRGIDINQGLLVQARNTYGDKPYVDFVECDLNEFDFTSDEPYDLYLANYGTLSHNRDEQTIEFLSKIAKYSEGGAIVAIDWLGRYAYEWQTLWTKDLENNQWMDYAISYIYADGDREQRGITTFPLRIVGRSEIQFIYSQAKKEAGGGLSLAMLADRSSFVGRHMDTAHYNRNAQPLRGLVNSLFEPSVSTNLDELLTTYIPLEGFDEVNTYHEELSYWWNFLIQCTKAFMNQSIPPQATQKVPAVVKRVADSMKKTVEAVAEIRIGNPRSYLIESQLGCCLRELEMGLQRGLGCGHGLVGIFEIIK